MLSSCLSYVFQRVNLRLVNVIDVTKNDKISELTKRIDLPPIRQGVNATVRSFTRQVYQVLH